MLKPKEMDAYLMKAIKGTAGYFKLSPEELARTSVLPTVADYL